MVTKASLLILNLILLWIIDKITDFILAIKNFRLPDNEYSEEDKLRMAVFLENHVEHYKKIIGAKILKGTIKIWTYYFDQLETLDDMWIELNLKLELISKEITDITFCTEGDQQTPRLYFEEV